MTDLNAAHPILDRDHKSHQTHGVVSLLFLAVLRMALSLLAQYGAAGGKRGPKTKAKLIFSLCLLFTLSCGSFAEKRAFLKRVLAHAKDTQDRLYAAYLVWRQRKCWMWGGGYAPGTVTGLPYVMSSLSAALSHDALIPD